MSRAWDHIKARAGAMGSRERLTTSMAGAVPVAQFTPDQVFFRAQAEGRYQADPDSGAHVPMYHVRRHPDGTCDSVMLEPDGDDYFEPSGQGGRDTAIRRP